MEEEIVGDYRGAWFELTANIDLGGMDWNPIGYYRDDSEFSGEVTHRLRQIWMETVIRFQISGLQEAVRRILDFLVRWMGRRSEI